MALLARHHFETWVTGMYLHLGGADAFKAFARAGRRADKIQQEEIDELVASGDLPEWPHARLDDLDEYDPAGWNYKTILDKIGKLGAVEGSIAGGTKEAYTIIYRTLSGHNGAHPTIRLLDRCIDSSLTFATVSPTAQLQLFREDAVRLALLLTAVHAGALLSKLDIPTEAYTAAMDHWSP